ncbi:hypothetical protein CWO85_03015 [Candidatus Phytoplasma ziziphi]|uniref:Uncharacterized protein n=1 Tax=Ziziphus jujuba witches'-broom phytoplasma TaxID=135727 RepID=A0A660HN29_ZIZJU|nr:hypothetical protein [Candidatus Phytoplasma ziziphi]AYJ01448.1 hypothetical protein CWO85_03015 [Candidatus Phytoplasma ziziphi]
MEIIKIINDNIKNVKKINMLILLKHLNVVSKDATRDIKINCLYHESKSKTSCDINNKNKVFYWGVVIKAGML